MAQRGSQKPRAQGSTWSRHPLPVTHSATATSLQEAQEELSDLLLACALPGQLHEGRPEGLEEPR